ncbi:MAG: hypothetical protein ACFFDF_01075 [Candidatus Odinarchaeota archaeon]
MSNEDLDSLKRIKGKLISNFTHTQGFVDCCEEYSFIRPFDTINFNNKMNRLGITHLVMDEDYNFSEMLEYSIRDPILNRSNNVFGLIGKTGTGKSELAETVSLISKRDNREFLGRDVELYLCYLWEDFHATLEKIKKGDIIWKDEMPRTIGKGSRVQKWEIDNVLHSIRKMENTFIFVDPIDINVDLCDVYIESAGMNFKARTNRFMLLNERKEYFGHIYVKLHDDERFRDWYETQKDKFIDYIVNLGGKVNLEEKDDGSNKKFKRYMGKLEKHLTDHYFNSENKKRDIRMYLDKKERKETLEELSEVYNLSISTISYALNKIDGWLEDNSLE